MTDATKSRSTGSPLVSVILPTHNRSVMLSVAIQSVLEQSFAELELIVVDDCSTDGTAELLGEIVDPRLVCLRNDRRRGAAISRNAGVAAARGEFVAFQDSDDEWLPGKLEHQLRLFADHGSSLGAVGGRYRIEGGAKTLAVKAPNLEAGHDYEQELLVGPCCITPLWLIRRRLVDQLGRFDERMPCLEDWDLMLRLSKATSMKALAEDVLIKRGAPDSLGADIPSRMAGMEELLRRHGDRFHAFPRRHASYCLELGYLCFVSGRSRDAWHYSLQALSRGRPSWRMLRAFAQACLEARSTGHPRWPIPGVVGES